MRDIFKNGLDSLKKNSKSESESFENDLNLTSEEYTLLNYLIEESQESLTAIQTDKDKTSFLSKINSTTTNTFNVVSANISKGFVNSKNKINQLTDATKDLALKSKDVISSNSNKVFENISAIEKKKLFNKVINSVDLLVIINLLNTAKNKSTNNPKQVLAITGLITVLSYFNNNKQNEDAIDNFQENKEVNNVLKKISLKEILNYADSVVIVLPPQFKIPFLVIINLLKIFV